MQKGLSIISLLILALSIVLTWGSESLASKGRTDSPLVKNALLPFESLLQRFDLDGNGMLDGKDALVLLGDADTLGDRPELDLNDDGVVDIYDGVMLAILLGLSQENEKAKGVLDFNNDGRVDLKDYRFTVPNMGLVPKLIGNVTEADLQSAGWQASMHWIPERNFIFGPPPPDKTAIEVITPGLILIPIDPASDLSKEGTLRLRNLLGIEKDKPLPPLWHAVFKPVPKPASGVSVSSVTILPTGALQLDDTALRALGGEVQIILGSEYIIRLPEGEIIPVRVDELLKTPGGATLWNNQQIRVSINQWWKAFSSFLLPEAEATRPDTLAQLFLKTINKRSLEPMRKTEQLWQKSGKDINRMIITIARQKKKALEELKRDPKCRRLRCEGAQHAIDAMADMLGAVKTIEVMLRHNEAVAAWYVGIASEGLHLAKKSIREMKNAFTYLKILEVSINLASPDVISLYNAVMTATEVPDPLRGLSGDAVKLSGSVGLTLKGYQKEIGEIRNTTTKALKTALKEGKGSKELGKIISNAKKKIGKARGKLKADGAGAVISFLAGKYLNSIKADMDEETRQYVGMYQETRLEVYRYRLARQLTQMALSRAKSLQSDIQKTLNALQQAVDVCKVHDKINKCYEIFDKAAKEAQDKLKSAEKEYKDALAKVNKPIKNLQKRIKGLKSKIEENRKKIGDIHKYSKLKRRLAGEKKYLEKIRSWIKEDEDWIKTDEKLRQAALGRKRRKHGIQVGSERERKILDNLEDLKKMKNRQEKRIKSLEEKMKSLKVNRRQSDQSLSKKSGELIKKNEKLWKKISNLRNKLAQEQKIAGKKRREARQILERTKREVADAIKKAEKALAECLAKAKTTERPRTVERTTPSPKLRRRGIADATIAAKAFEDAVKRTTKALKDVRIYTVKLPPEECEKTPPDTIGIPEGGEETTITLIQVIPLSGNNPFNPEDPISEGYTTGGEEITSGEGTTGGTIPPCSAGPTTMDTTYIAVNFSYIETTGECELQPGVDQSPKFLNHGAYIFLLRGPSNVCDGGCLQMGNSFWSLVSSSAGTVTPGQFGGIQNIPLNTPVDIVVQCTGAGCPAGNPMYTGTIIITPTTGEVQNFRPQ